MKFSSRLASLPILVLIAACGSAASPGGNSGPGTEQVALTAQNIAFTPSVITAQPGQKIALTFTNHDGFPHNFTVSELKVNQDVEPGKTVTFVFTATGNKDLQFYCEYHKAKGMVGTLSLSGAAPAASPTDTTAPAASTSPYTGY